MRANPLGGERGSEVAVDVCKTGHILQRYAASQVPSSRSPLWVRASGGLRGPRVSDPLALEAR